MIKGISAQLYCVFLYNTQHHFWLPDIGKCLLTPLLQRNKEVFHKIFESHNVYIKCQQLVLTCSGLTSSQSLPTLIAVRMLSPVTMTVLISASWRLLMAGYVSSFTRFCITIRPRNSDFSSKSGLLKIKLVN